MRDVYHPRQGLWNIRPAWAAGLGWLAFAAAALAGGSGAPVVSPSPLAAQRVETQAASAERLMARAEDFLEAARQASGVRSEAAGDRSGLIGAEVTPLVTTLGSLEAKRLATNPAWASALVKRLADAGLRRGDLVAAGFSGSFPGLNLAVVEACRALGLDLIAVTSVTASTWGANQPGFTWPEIDARLVEAGLVPRTTVAVASGGDADQGLDLDAEGRAMAAKIRDETAARLGVAALRPNSYRDAVSDRMEAYRRASGGRPIALYVNVGGADASIGRSTAVLKLKTGFLPPVPFDASEDRGVMARFADDRVRLLLLLNVRELAARWGIPFAGHG
jgi:poly-gamma-glutamate system protein